MMKRIGTDFGITICWATKWFKQHRQKEKKIKSSKSKPSKIKSEVKKEASPSRPSRNFVRVDNPTTCGIISPHRPLATSRRHKRKKVEKPTSNVISSLYKIEYQAAQRWFHEFRIFLVVLTWSSGPELEIKAIQSWKAQ